MDDQRDFVETYKRALKALDALDWHAADHLCQQLVEMQPHIPELHYNHSHVLREMGNTSGAIGAARRAVDLDADDPDFRYRLAEILIDVGSPEEATEHLKVTVSKDPESAHAHFLLGALAHTRRDLGEAESGPPPILWMRS